MSYRRTSKSERILVPAAKFCGLVVCSALLSTWLQSQWQGSKLRGSKRAVTETAMESVDGQDPAIAAVGKMEDLYRKHLEEILRSLRTNPSVRMVKLRLPNLILNYQRNLASIDSGSSLRLQARTAQIPVLAVSVGSRRYLEQMLITYIDPKGLPPRLIDPGVLPFNPRMLPNFLLVPDLSGTNAAAFSFERR